MHQAAAGTTAERVRVNPHIEDGATPTAPRTEKPRPRTTVRARRPFDRHVLRDVPERAIDVRPNLIQETHGRCRRARFTLRVQMNRPARWHPRPRTLGQRPHIEPAGPAQRVNVNERASLHTACPCSCIRPATATFSHRSPPPNRRPEMVNSYPNHQANFPTAQPPRRSAANREAQIRKTCARDGTPQRPGEELFCENVFGLLALYLGRLPTGAAADRPSRAVSVLLPTPQHGHSAEPTGKLWQAPAGFTKPVTAAPQPPKQTACRLLQLSATRR